MMVSVIGLDLCSGDVRLSWPCSSLSRGMETGLCWRETRGLVRRSVGTSCACKTSLVLSFLSTAASTRAILVFLRPLAGALAVRRRRWSLRERFRMGIPVSTDVFEALLNRPLKPFSWRFCKNYTQKHENEKWNHIYVLQLAPAIQKTITSHCVHV